MKKIILYVSLLLVIILFVLSMFYFKNNKENDLKTIKVAEVTHSMFYAPWYVAIENGYFEEEGLKIDLILTSGADKVSAAVLSNDVNIGFCGPEGSIYVYTGGEKDFIQTFAGLTKRDGQFIVARENIENFSLDNIKSHEILVGRNGGMPALNFLNALYNSNINENDMKINYSVDFASLSGAFISNEGDFVNLFEDNAVKRKKVIAYFFNINN